MTRLTRTQRILFGVLGLAVIGLGYDSYQRGGGPRRAQGGQQTPGAAGASLRSRQDVAALIRRLTTTRYEPIQGELVRASRDPFLPSPLMQQAYHPPEPESEPDPAEIAAAARAAQAPPPPAFDEVHRVTAVLLGRRPVAVVNGQMLSLGAELAGHRLVEIRRNVVVFENLDSGSHVSLTLTAEDGD